MWSMGLTSLGHRPLGLVGKAKGGSSRLTLTNRVSRLQGTRWINESARTQVTANPPKHSRRGATARCHHRPVPCPLERWRPAPGPSPAAAAPSSCLRVAAASRRRARAAPLPNPPTAPGPPTRSRRGAAGAVAHQARLPAPGSCMLTSSLSLVAQSECFQQLCVSFTRIKATAFTLLVN